MKMPLLFRLACCVDVFPRVPFCAHFTAEAHKRMSRTRHSPKIGRHENHSPRALHSWRLDFSANSGLAIGLCDTSASRPPYIWL